jgi:hypothetical protein
MLEEFEGRFMVTYPGKLSVTPSEDDWGAATIGVELFARYAKVGEQFDDHGYAVWECIA